MEAKQDQSEFHTENQTSKNYQEKSEKRRVMRGG